MKKRPPRRPPIVPTPVDPKDLARTRGGDGNKMANDTWTVIR